MEHEGIASGASPVEGRGQNLDMSASGEGAAKLQPVPTQEPQAPLPEASSSSSVLPANEPCNSATDAPIKVKEEVESSSSSLPASTDLANSSSHPNASNQEPSVVSASASSSSSSSSASSSTTAPKPQVLKPKASTNAVLFVEDNSSDDGDDDDADDDGPLLEDDHDDTEDVAPKSKVGPPTTAPAAPSAELATSGLHAARSEGETSGDVDIEEGQNAAGAETEHRREGEGEDEGSGSEGDDQDDVEPSPGDGDAKRQSVDNHGHGDEEEDEEKEDSAEDDDDDGRAAGASSSSAVATRSKRQRRLDESLPREAAVLKDSLFPGRSYLVDGVMRRRNKKVSYAASASAASSRASEVPKEFLFECSSSVLLPEWLQKVKAKLPLVSLVWNREVKRAVHDFIFALYKVPLEDGKQHRVIWDQDDYLRKLKVAEQLMQGRRAVKTKEKLTDIVQTALGRRLLFPRKAAGRSGAAGRSSKGSSDNDSSSSSDSGSESESDGSDSDSDSSSGDDSDSGSDAKGTRKRPAPGSFKHHVTTCSRNVVPNANERGKTLFHTDDTEEKELGQDLFLSFWQLSVEDAAPFDAKRYEKKLLPIGKVLRRKFESGINSVRALRKAAGGSLGDDIDELLQLANELKPQKLPRAAASSSSSSSSPSPGVARKAPKTRASLSSSTSSSAAPAPYHVVTSKSLPSEGMQRLFCTSDDTDKEIGKDLCWAFFGASPEGAVDLRGRAIICDEARYNKHLLPVGQVLSSKFSSVVTAVNALRDAMGGSLTNLRAMLGAANALEGEPAASAWTSSSKPFIRPGRSTKTAASASTSASSATASPAPVVRAPGKRSPAASLSGVKRRREESSESAPSSSASSSSSALEQSDVKPATQPSLKRAKAGDDNPESNEAQLKQTLHRQLYFATVKATAQANAGDQAVTFTFKGYSVSVPPASNSASQAPAGTLDDALGLLIRTARATAEGQAFTIGFKQHPGLYLSFAGSKSSVAGGAGASSSSSGIDVELQDFILGMGCTASGHPVDNGSFELLFHPTAAVPAQPSLSFPSSSLSAASSSSSSVP